MARLVFFLELLRAVRLRRDRRELSGAAFGEGRVALLQVLDEVQAAHPVVKATAHGLARADRLGRIGKANSYLLQVGDKRAVVLVAGRLVEARLRMRRHGKHQAQEYAMNGEKRFNPSSFFGFGSGLRDRPVGL